MLSSHGQRSNCRPAALAEVEAWNQCHGFGSPVRFWLGAKVGDPCGESVTYSAATVMEGVAVVFVIGMVEAIPLAMIEVIRNGDER